MFAGFPPISSFLFVISQICIFLAFQKIATCPLYSTNQHIFPYPYFENTCVLYIAAVSQIRWSICLSQKHQKDCFPSCNFANLTLSNWHVVKDLALTHIFRPKKPFQLLTKPTKCTCSHPAAHTYCTNILPITSFFNLN